MKNLFKKIALLGAAIITLASCSSLLPNRPVRSKNSSEVITDYDDRSSSYNQETNGSGQYFLNGPSGIFLANIDEEYAFEYSLTDIISYGAGQIDEYSVEYVGSLDFYFDLVENRRSLRVTVIPYDGGLFDCSINISSRNGETYKAFMRFVVSQNRADSDVYIEYEHYIRVPYNCGWSMGFRAYNRQTGYNLKLNKDHPFDVGYINESFVEMDNYSVYDNDEFLDIYFYSKDYGIDSVDIKLILDDGSTHNVTLFIEVVPDWRVETSVPLYVAYNDYLDVTFEVVQFDYQGNAIDASLDLNKSTFMVNGFTYEILDFSSYKITIRFYNNLTDWGGINLFLVTEEGYYLEWGNTIVSEYVYEVERWINLDIYEFTYQRESLVRFYLSGYSGQTTIIRDIEIVFEYGKIDDCFVTNLYEDYFEYYFVPYDYGDEIMHVSITSEEGYLFETEYSLYINR